jgi:hypothetical protein
VVPQGRQAIQLEGTEGTRTVKVGNRVKLKEEKPSLEKMKKYCLMLKQYSSTILSKRKTLKSM